MSSIIYDSLDYSMLVGDSYRIKECPNCIGMGNSNAVQITRKEDGFVWNCFRCMKVPGQKHAGFVPDKNVSPKQAMELINNVNKKKENTRPQVVVLPTDITYTLPPKALVQLYDNQIMDIDMQAHEIGWSPSHARIIIPLFKYGNGPGGGLKSLLGILDGRLTVRIRKRSQSGTQLGKEILSIHVLLRFPRVLISKKKSLLSKTCSVPYGLLPQVTCRWDF